MNRNTLFAIGGGIIILLIALFVVFDRGAVERVEKEKYKPVVAATIFPLFDIVREVAGTKTQVKLILPAGASPHTFDPTPATLKKLQKSELVFAVHEDIDGWVEGVAKNIPDSRVLHMDEHITLQPFPDLEEHHDEEEHEEHSDHEDGHEEDGHDDHDDHEEHGDEHENEHDDHGEHAHHDHAHGEFDPHYWLDPDNAIIIAHEVAHELSELDPDNAAYYETNAQAFADKIEKKKAVWAEKLTGISSRNVVTFHDAFGYFARHFDLNVIATFEPFAGKEPTPSYLQALQKEIQEEGISTLFIEPQLSAAALEQFAQDNNLTIGTLDPIGGADDRLSYIDVMQYNVESIAQALQ